MIHSFTSRLLLLAALVVVQAPAWDSLLAQERVFRAGAATSNITPWVGGSMNGSMQDKTVENVHDELHARALVLDDGTRRLALVVVDACLVPRDIIDEAKRQASVRTGIPGDHMMVSATHTHTGGTLTPAFQSFPDERYRQFVTARIGDAVSLANHNLQTAEIGWGTGQVPQHLFNRRWKMKPGTIPPNPFGQIDQVQMNPPAGSPNMVEPSGPIDPTLSILAVRTPAGEPIAIFANYSLHYVGGIESGNTSADYFGAFARRIRDLLGAGNSTFVGIMSNGASGNINNTNFTNPRPARKPYEQMNQVADDVAQEALRVYKGMTFQKWVPLNAKQTEIQLGVRRPSRDELMRAKRLIMQAEGPAMKTREEIYARETLFLDDYPEQVSAVLQVMKIGDLGLAAIPCEVFVEIGLELRKRSPFRQFFTVSLANGYNGYLPTEEHHRLGGYETWRARSSYLEEKAASKIIDQFIRLFQDF